MPLTDDVEVKKWEEHNKIFHGFVKKGTTTVHGPVRIILPNKWMEERQEKNGLKHGHSRIIWYDGRYDWEHHKDGIRHGPEVSHKRDGTRKYTRQYYEGEMVKEEVLSLIHI